MAQKHLHQLLEEDQEPFVLKDFIADRKKQLPRTSHLLQLKKRKPHNFPSNFCKNACFFADSKRSPLFEFQSPVKSPCKSPIFLQIPSRTAALLLEAALRIQKSSSKTKNNNGASFSLFGSILKRITHRGNKSPKLITANDGAQVSVKDILRWEDGKNSNQRQQRKTSSAMEDHHQSGRPSSAVWSEKSMDMDLDTSCSCSQSEDFADTFISEDFCESPFHFVLQTSPSFSHQTPLFSSPTTSPTRRQKEDKENYEAESSKKLQVEEEEEEQCSPVSVLDPPFEDDDDKHMDDDNNDDEIDGFDLECSYANMQRAKNQLLHKLRRFEKLAELDPVELEKRMLEDDDDDICDLEEEYELENESVSSDITEMDMDVVLREVMKLSFRNPGGVPDGMKRLVSDLVAQEETDDVDREMVAKRICKRLESWKDVESNTIDMMVEQDLRRSGWKRNEEEIKEAASQLEYAIYGLLMDELSEELVRLTEI